MKRVRENAHAFRVCALFAPRLHLNVLSTAREFSAGAGSAVHGAGLQMTFNAFRRS